MTNHTIFDQWIKAWQHQHAGIQRMLSETKIAPSRLPVEFIKYSLVTKILDGSEEKLIVLPLEDRSLIYYDPSGNFPEIYKWIPPIFLKGVWHSSPQQLKTSMWDIIEYEKKMVVKGSVNPYEFIHILQLKNIIAWVLRYKHKDIDQKIKRKLMAGDFKQSETHFTVDRKIEI